MFQMQAICPTET